MKTSQLRQKAMKESGHRKSRAIIRKIASKKFSRQVDAELRAMCGRRGR